MLTPKDGSNAADADAYEPSNISGQRPPLSGEVVEIKTKLGVVDALHESWLRRPFELEVCRSSECDF